MPKKMSLCVEMTVDDDATESSLREYLETALPKMGTHGETTEIDSVDAVYELIDINRK